MSKDDGKETAEGADIGRQSRSYFAETFEDDVCRHSVELMPATARCDGFAGLAK